MKLVLIFAAALLAGCQEPVSDDIRQAEQSLADASASGESQAVCDASRALEAAHAKATSPYLAGARISADIICREVDLEKDATVETASLAAATQPSAEDVAHAGVAEPAAKPDEQEAPAPRCWMDYCPCVETGEIDVGLCRDLRAGLPVDDAMMSAGAKMRDARRSLERWKTENPSF